MFKKIKTTGGKILHWGPLAWLLGFLRRILSLVARWLIPALLLILISLPLILTFARNQKKEETFPEPEKVQFGTLVKSVKNNTTVEFDYSYEVKNWQTANLEQILVKEGDKVTAGQVLANVSFVNTAETRDTDTQNQLRLAQQDLANLQRARGDLLGVTGATLDQSEVQLGGKQIEEKLATEKFLDKDRENQEKRERLTRERDAFQKTYDELRLAGNSLESLNQYQTEIKTKQDQLNTLTIKASTVALQNQINQQNSTTAGLRTQISSGICDNNQPTPGILIGNPSSSSLVSSTNSSVISSSLPVAPVFSQSTKAPYNAVACDSAYAQINAAQAIIANLQQQLANQTNTDNNLINRLQAEIADLQRKIETIKKSPAYQNLPDLSLPLSDAQITANTQKILTDLQQEITSRKNDLKALDDTNNLLPLEDQLKTAARARNQLEYDRQLQSQTLSKNLSDLEQKMATTRTTIQNLQAKLLDVQEDMQEQIDSKTLKAKKDGIIGQVNFEEKVQVPAASNIFEVISEQKLLRLVLSAETRNNLKEGLPVRIINPEYTAWENLKLTKIGASPLPKTAQNTDTQYEIEVAIPQDKQSELTVGKNLDLEIILEKRDNVYFVGRTAVLEGKVYVGLGERKTDKEAAKYQSFAEKPVQIGLDTGRFIQITGGLEPNDLVFPIFPKTEADRAKLQAQFLAR